MFILRYNGSQIGPSYYFQLDSDQFIDDNLIVIAFKSNNSMEKFLYISHQTLQLTKFLVGSLASANNGTRIKIIQFNENDVGPIVLC